jgi:hypothetical protein
MTDSHISSSTTWVLPLRRGMQNSSDILKLSGKMA